MNFNEHWNLRGKHAFLSPSQPYWLKYDEEKLRIVFRNMQAKQRGTELHEFAAKAIELGEKLSHSKKSFNRYVNDAIGFGLKPEKVLYYSDHCFGTADAIDFRDGLLRIHDLKTGVHKAKMDQLEVYAALFCLEYGINPSDIDIVLRIYQNDEVFESNPSSDLILDDMNVVINSSRIVSEEDN